MTWRGGFSGKGLTRADYKTWLATQAKPSWVKFLVLHNTGAPNIDQAARTPGGESQRVKNFENYYKNQNHWSGGPHAFVFSSGLVYDGTPLGVNGTHSPSWNDEAWGLEMVADFRTGVDDPLHGKGWVVFDTTAWVFAQWLQHLGLPANNDTIKLHKEDKKTTHDCPGNLVVKATFIELVKAYMGEKPPVVEDVKSPVQGMTVNTPGDTLNFRAIPGGKVTGTLPDGTKVTVLGTKNAWSNVQTPAGYKGWVYSKFLTVPRVPNPVKPPEPPVIEKTEPVYQPGEYKYDEFAISWAKRFEGLMLKAYWDRNDWAIGYGHNNGSGVPPAVKEGDTITTEQAIEILHKDLDLQLKYVKAYVNIPLTQGEVNALVLHIFQQGPGNFRNGKVRPLINDKKFAEAAAAIQNWPTTNAGLIRRRAVEAQIFNGLLPTKW